MSHRSKRIKRQQRQRESRKIEAGSIPTSFRILDASGTDGLRLEAVAGDETKKLRTFDMLAYNGGLMKIAGFSYPVIVDLKGLTVTAKSRPVLREHKRERIVGHTTGVVITDKFIRVQGAISAANKHAKEVVEAADNEFPWQASIGASPDKVEFLAKNESAQVNGRKIIGPAYVVRAGTLNEFSFVALGGDDTTAVRVAATSQQQEFSAMTYEEWLVAQGFDKSTLNASQVKFLEAAYKREQSDSEESDDAPVKPIKAAGSDCSSLAGDVEKDIRARALAETKRIACIGKHASKFPEIAAKAIEEGWDETRVELEVLRADRPKAPAGHVHSGEVNALAVEAALCMSAKVPDLEKQYKPEVLEAAHKHHRNIGIQEVLLLAAAANGYQCRPGQGLHQGNLREVLRYAFPDVHAAGPTTLSVPGLMSNVANKELLAGYMEDDQTWREIASVKSVRDFKQVTSYRMLDNMEYEQLAPDGEIKHGSISEESYTRQANTYAKMFALTRADIINDDLSAFDDLRTRLGRGASKKFNNLFWSTFMDNSSFFTSGLTNYISGSTTNLGVDGVGLELAVKAFRKMTSPTADGAKRIGGRPTLMLVPPELEFIADRLYKSAHVNTGGSATATSVPDSNIHANKYRPVVVNWLSDSDFTGYSTTAWYLFRPPQDMAAVVVSFLNGVETPTVESADADFNQLGIQFRGFHDFGVDKAEYLAGLKSKGAA